MIYKYEMACKEAGLSEEQTAEIRKFFDGEKKKLHRDMEAREAEGIIFNSLCGLVEDYVGLDEFEIPDWSGDLESMYIHQEDLKKLRECVAELPVEDREFLFALFSGGYGSESQLARDMNVPRLRIRRRKEKLIERLRKNFFKEI
jgi:DNA-directed RNA polymerase specialized sigma24 family protein